MLQKGGAAFGDKGKNQVQNVVLCFLSSFQVIFEHEGVFIHSNTEELEDQDSLISGYLRIVDKVLLTWIRDPPIIYIFLLCCVKDSSSVVEWTQRPHRTVDQQLSYETEWDMVNAVSFKRKAHTNGEGAFSFNVADLRSVTVKCEGWSYLIFCLKDDTTLPAIHFHQGGSQAFLDGLRKSVGEGIHHCQDMVQPFLEGETYSVKVNLCRCIDKLICVSVCVCLLQVDLGTRPEVQRREPVMMEDWAKHQDSEGRVSNVPHLKHLIFKGGLCHAVRKDAWKFLLDYYPWDSTHEERKNLQKRKTDEYFRMKLQWKSVSEEQEKRNSRLRDYKSLIEKDVNRTDRTNKFYEGLDNPGLILLHDILMTYCMYDFDLGYVQGMSDLLSPILYVMENEVDAFWCFVSFMDQMHENFEEQMQGMKTQLIQLSTLLRLLDLAFWNYLEAQDSGYLYFCFRWLLIRFKRELHFQDVLRLWEVMWTGLPCHNFHLLVCCAILDSEKQKIMDRHYGFNEILKHINELSMKLDIEEILIKSEAIYMQIKNCKDLPNSVSDILGLNAVTNDSTLETSEYGVLESPQSSPRPAHRQDQAYSNGHGLLQEASHNRCKVAFIS
uniref:TBC1 domain family member 15 n=1 Tax=Astyanax mexicanus TaxID=7994 RepID=A0A8B9L266_ASTMX